MSEIITASAVRFNALPTAHDGYTLLYENNRVCQSDVKLSELVGDMSAYLTEEKANTLYQGKGDYLSASTSANFYPMTGNPSGFLTSEKDWTDTIKAASANAVNTTSAYVSANYYNIEEINDFLDEKYDTSSFAAVSGTFQEKLTFAGENNTITAINSSAIGGGSNNSWKEWSEDHNSSGDENSVYIGKDLTSENGGIIIGDIGADADLPGFDPELTKANNGLVITKAFKDIPESAYEQYGLKPEFMKSSSGDLNFGYNEIVYNSETSSFDNKEIIDNTKWAASATNGGIAIGRAVTADLGGIAISPKFNKLNQNQKVIGTSASNEGIAIGEGVAATNGGLAFGKNGLSASNGAVGIGRIGTANNASVLLSNDLRQAAATTGNTYCYFDNTEQKYRPVDKTLQKYYYNPQNIDSKKYNPTTSAFENITGTHSDTFTNVKMILVNEYDGQITFCYSYINSTTVSGYYDENLKFHKVNSQSEVPEGETFVKSYSAYDITSWLRVGIGSVYNDILYTTAFYVYDNSAIYKVIYDDNKYLNLKCYEYYKFNNLYNYLKTKPLLSGYIDPDSMSGKVYYGAYYDDNPKSPTSGEIIAENQYIDYLKNDHGQKIYIEDIVLTSVSAKFEPVTLANYNGVGIGQNFTSKNSILLNTNGNSYLGHIASNSALSYRYGTALSSTDSNTRNVFKENTFFTNGIIHSSATQPTADGESILLSPNGRNVYAYGESLLLGRVDTSAMGRSVAIGNRQYADGASLAIGYADEYDGIVGSYETMCNIAQKKSLAIGILNSAVDYSIAFGRYNSAFNDGFSIGKYNYTNGDTYAFGERNYIVTGKSMVLGYENSACSSYESYIVGFRNTLNGGSVQVSFLGHQNSADCGNIQGIVAGNNNNAVGSNLQTVILGTDNQCSVVSMQGIELGCKNRISCGSVRGTVIGVENTASMRTFDGVLIGNCNTASYSDTQAVIIGNSNNGAIQQGVLLGQHNSAIGNPIMVGYRNKNSYASQDIMYGYNNLAEGESFVFGNSNDAISGGHNVALGLGNTARHEAINIGTLNNSVGHSISIGWNNIANTNRFAHTIMIGKANSADTNKSDLRPNKPFRVVDNEILTYTADNPETNNFIVGTNNSASHYNSIIIGSKNQTLSAVPNPDAEPGEELYDDDGFTVALGLGNIAARNYDMAIGYSTLASGGENIAIGAPQKDPYYGLLWNTNAVGYRNIAIRSNVSGIGNIAFESNFEGKGINNVILNSQITGATDNYAGYSEYPIARNDIRYSNGILNISNDLTDNVIKTTTANIDCKGYCVNNTIQNSYIDITVNDVMISNFINTTTATGITDTFRHNVIFFSDIDVTSGDYNFSYYDKEQNHSNFLVGVNARNVIGTFGFADKSLNSLQEVVRSYSFGDNHLKRVRESTVFGQSNYLSSTDKSFVVGNGNSIHVPCSDSSDEPASMELIIGFDNIMEYSSITSTNCRNKIIGNTNQFYSDGETTDNFIIGNNNKFFYFDSIPDNRAHGYPVLPDYAYENTFTCYRNMVFGTYNAVSQYISNGFIVGDSNVIMTDNVSDKSFNKTRSKYDSSIVFGFGNVAYNGSKQIAMGDFNTVSGHFAYAFGEDLSAQDFQMVVGKYNAPVPKTTRTTSAWENNSVVELENSGVVFVVGNGRLNCYEKDGAWYDGQRERAIYNLYDENLITRSNALTVSANGVVSASDYITSGNYKLSELNEIIDFLRNKPSTGTYVMKCIDGTLTWVIDNT